MSQRVGLSLERAVAATAALQPISVSASVQADVRTYVTGRLEQLLIDGGVPAEAGAVVLRLWGGGLLFVVGSGYSEGVHAEAVAVVLRPWHGKGCVCVHR